MLVLGLPTGTPNEIHELLKAGSMVVRPQVQDAQTLSEMVPLARARYVDGLTTIPTALQNGTIAYPYSTLAQAVADLAAIGGVVLIAPGSYTEPQVNIGANTPICLVALGIRSFSGPSVSFTNSVVSQSDIAAYNIAFINALQTSQRIIADGCSITNFAAGSGVSQLTDCQIVNVTCSGTLTAWTTSFTNNTTLGIVNSNFCQWNGLSCTGALSANYSTFSTAVIVGGAAVVNRCNFGLAMSVTGQLVADYGSIAPKLSTITWGSFNAAQSQVSPKITVSVAVPAVAAGQVGYVDVALGATKLNGLVPAGSMLIANPTADLVAAGAGGGFINVRASAANTARFAFLGPIAGGATDFLLGVI